MTAPPNPEQPDKPEPMDPLGSRVDWVNRRREKIIAEIQANRRGDFRVPTWVLTAVLVVLVIGFGIWMLVL